MKYVKAEKYQSFMPMIMGPNPLKLEEELLENNLIPAGARVMDLGSGSGLTSVFLVKEYGFTVYAADLWSDPNENQAFFAKLGLNEQQIKAVKADANDLQFEKEFFESVVSTDSYNYFGRDKTYLDEKLLPFIKKGGYVYIVVPGMKKDLHDDLPSELLLSWNSEQLDYLHDADYWRDIMSACVGAEIVEIREMEANEDVWADWIACENEYAISDRAAINAGGCKYLNFVKIVMRKK